MTTDARSRWLSRPVAVALALLAGTVAVIAGALLLSGPSGPVALDGPAHNDDVLDLSDAGREVTVELTVDGDGFHPAFVKVAPGAEVAVVIHNRGEVEHTFVSENDLLSLDEHIRPGDSGHTPFAFEMPADRAVRFFDHDHYWEGGFQGAFYTEEGQPLIGGDELPEHPDE